MNKDLITISVKKDDYSIIVKVPSEMFDTKTDVIVNALKTSLNIIAEEKTINVIPKKIKEQILTPKSDEFKVRERIPNNIVDIKTLDIKQAVTENSLVRCPNCGQSHVIAINSGDFIYAMRKFYSSDGNNDEFRIIAEFNSAEKEKLLNMSCKPDTDRKAYFEDIRKIKILDDRDFNVNNDTEIFCPVCCKSDSFIHWKDAYENPLNYFETEHLCDVCGGEVITKMIKKQKVNKCEKCGHETPHEEV